jgi:hypothetical protein
MSLINDSTNTRSLYPITLDSLSSFTNGVGSNSIINAETWNTIETILYRLQTHSQTIPLFFDSADRHRVCVSGTVFVSTSGNVASQIALSNFTAGQLAFLNGGVTRSGSLILADVFALDTTDDCTANVTLGNGVVSVTFRRTDPTQALSIGHYLVMVTVLGY